MCVAVRVRIQINKGHSKNLDKELTEEIFKESRWRPTNQYFKLNSENILLNIKIEEIKTILFLS